MAHCINDIVNTKLIGLVTVTGGIESIKGMLPSIAEIGVEIDHHHQPAVVIEQAVHRGGIIRIIQRESPAEVPRHPSSRYLFDFIDVKKTMENSYKKKTYATGNFIYGICC